MTTTSTPFHPSIFQKLRPEAEPGPHLKMIEAAKAQGSEYWQIWHLFAFRPEMTIHLGRFTHEGHARTGADHARTPRTDRGLYVAIK